MVNLIQNGIVSPVLYHQLISIYGRVKLSKPLPIDTGFAGFAFTYPLNDTHVFDEVISFLGTSYFPIPRTRSAVRPIGARALRRSRNDKRKLSLLSQFWLEPLFQAMGTPRSTPCSTAKPRPAPIASI